VQARQLIPGAVWRAAWVASVLLSAIEGLLAVEEAPFAGGAELIEFGTIGAGMITRLNVG